MSRLFRSVFPLLAVVLLCGSVMAERLCARCNAKSESEKWVYCPFCGMKYSEAAAGSQSEPVLERERYERVSWEKIRVDHEKFNHRFVCFEARFDGIKHHFAPVEKLGITEQNYVNFCIVGNWTNYVKRSNLKLVERLKRLSPLATITIFARVDVLKTYSGATTIVVSVEDIDL